MMQPVRIDARATYLSCFVCDQPPQQPKMCPRCGRAFCAHCLFSNYHSIKQQCPACQAKVPLEEFVQSNVIHVMLGQIAQRVKRQLRRAQDRQQCLQHQLPLSYYCIECKHPLCGDCGLLTTKHAGHKFISYRDVYQRIKKKVFDQFPRFDRKIQILVERKLKLRMSLQNLHDNYRRYKKHFQESYIAYTEKVEANTREFQENINMRAQANLQRLSELQHLRDNIYEEIQKKTQVTLIKQSATLSQSISSLSEQEPSQVQLDKPQEKEDLIQLMPQFVTWRYQLQSFSTKSGIVYSQPKTICGVQWRLKIYPKGNGLARQKYISVFVQMTHAFTSQNKYEYRIQLINPIDPTQSVRRQYCSNFQVGECWGYNQFQQLQQLQLRQFLQNDSLLFEIGIRNRTYRSLVDDQVLYIQALKKQIKEKQRLRPVQRVGESSKMRKKDKNEKTTKKIRQQFLQKKEVQQVLSKRQEPSARDSQQFAFEGFDASVIMQKKEQHKEQGLDLQFLNQLKRQGSSQEVATYDLIQELLRRDSKSQQK